MLKKRRTAPLQRWSEKLRGKWTEMEGKYKGNAEHKVMKSGGPTFGGCYTSFFNQMWWNINKTS